MQIAVIKEMRNCHIGTSLLSYVGNNYSNSISITNVDNNFRNAQIFFESKNLSNYLSQDEMQLQITV